jgi:hypothetical protein
MPETIPHNPPRIAPPKGCRETLLSSGITVARLHYSADPSKDLAWAEEQRARSEAQFHSGLWFKQEMEIDFAAALGAPLFPEFNRDYTVCKPFKIPSQWTRWHGIDPHPRVPHAMLWLAVSPSDDHVYYRDYWPSKIYGIRGDVPEDDHLFHIDDYAKTIRMLESSKVDVFGANGFADNGGRDEKIFRRIMDPAGKAFPVSVMDGKPEPTSMWDRYRDEGIYCDEAKKDFEATREIVGKRLRGRKILDANGERMQSQIVVFSTCEELILELETNRFPRLSPAQMERKDPGGDPLPKRKHMTDLIRYIEAEDPYYVQPGSEHIERKPIYSGIAY